MEKEVTFTSKILSSCILDPYILILLEDNSIELYQVEASGEKIEISKKAVQLAEPGLLAGVTACSLFVDEARLFGEPASTSTSNQIFR